MATGLRPAAILIPALGLVLAGCGGERSTSTFEAVSPGESAAPSASTVAPLHTFADEALYHPAADTVAAAGPGEIIESVEIASTPGTRAWFVVYGSTGLDGRPVAVSGIIVAPDAPPPSDDGYPVVGWAHGTTGIADVCSPSHGGIGQLGPLLDLAADGYVVIATDYEGLGTDGVHPYLVGISEGRSVLDSIRAAIALPEARAGTEAVVIGLSQGGHATVWAAELQPSYAPELTVLGAFAASPPTDMVGLETWAFGQAAAGNIDAASPLLMVFGVWNTIYDDAPLDFLTDAGQASARAAPDGCDPRMPSTTPFLSDPALTDAWRQLLGANSPGAARTDVAIRVVSPESDQAVAYDTQLAGVAAMCARGDTVELVTVPGNHDDSIVPPAAWGEAVAWIKDRFAGVPAISTCP